MHTYRINGLLETLQQQTEALLDKAVQDWQMQSPGRFSAQPIAGGWSAAQCLAHLNSYGDYYLPLLEGAVTDGRNKPATAFTPGWLGNYFTKLMESGAGGVPHKKMKAFKQHTPAGDGDSDTIIAVFITQQEKLLSILEAAKGIDIGRRAIPVSIAPFIKLKTGDVFRFLIAHNRRHAAQAGRAVAQQLSEVH